MRFARTYVLAFFLLLLAFPSAAQVTTGTPPFGSFSGGPDVIDLGNVNSQIRVTVIHRAGRGLPLNFDLTYNTSVWYPAGSSSVKNWQPVSNWGFSAPGPVGYVTNTDRNTVCSGTHVNLDIFSNWTYVDGSGTSHPFSFATWGDTSTPCHTTTKTGVATDGSGYTMTATGGAAGNIISPDGTIIHAPTMAPGAGGTIQDRNGNIITSSGSSYTDTLGGTALTISGTAPNPVTYTYNAPGPNGTGASAFLTVTYQTYTVKTNFGCTNVVEYPATSFSLVDRITLADGSFYQFHYEPTPGFAGDYTGRLASITLPTGGSITYAYSGGGSGVNGINCSDGSPATLTRTTPDGTWTYVHSAGTAATTTVTDPQGNDAVVDFQGLYETQRQVYQGSHTSGTLLHTITTCYNGNTSNCTGTAVSTPISQRTITTQLGSNGLESQHVEFINSYGLTTEVDDYDYGSGGPGPLLRKVLTTYASLGNGIVDRVASTTVQDGGGHTLAQVTYTYDQGTPTPTSNTPQQASVSGSRGNPTTVTYLTQGSTSFSKTYTYFDTGNIQTITDVNGSAGPTYNYANVSSTCGNSFPTSVSEALSLSKSLTWNCTGAVATQLTDENLQVNTTTYTDPYFWRPASKTDPANATTSFFYPSSPSFNTFESQLLFNSGNSVVDTLTTLDSSGRAHVSQRKQGPSASNYDSVETDYDSLERPNRTTVPYNGTAGQANSNAPATTTSYDAIDRPLTITDAVGGTTSYTYTQNDVLISVGPAPAGENAKRRQLEYDGLGRLKSVCEITSAAGSGACGQTVAQTGYLTTYVYDTATVNSVLYARTTITQNAQPGGSPQTRVYLYDLLGRLVSETNPESGTTTNTFDTDTTCGTSNGDRVKRIDSAGNVTCTAYDALHRPTTITYPSGPNSSSTAMKVFYYDAPHFGHTTYNTKGRLASAGTCQNPTCAGPWITAEDFSYSARGEPSDLYESTPNSGGYYHVSATYWENGLTKQLASLADLPTINFAPDTEGRPNTVSASSGQNPVTGTTYNMYASPPQLTVNLGSGDSDVFNYDPNTLRMTQWQYNVSTQAVTGALTWNANGTLQKLVITDPINTADSQTCSYGYDDLTRLTSANCGAVWSQTFAYDSFGNISKSGSVSFQPSYSAATNRMTSVAGFTPTYDANGNVLTDPSHSYTMDAENRPVVIDAINLTYDAVGRMVEQNRSSVYTQIVYAPGGSKLALYGGQTLQKAIIPLTGGALAVYNSGGLLYYGHSDHLGNVRLGTTPSRTGYFSVAYAPFGETYASWGTTDVAFTGQRQDTVGGLYDFLAREYSTEGRWPSPDPAGLAAVSSVDPQSFNRYAYVRNNPLVFTDPLGMQRSDCKVASACKPPVSPGCISTCSSGGFSWSPDDFLNEMDYLMACAASSLADECINYVPGASRFASGPFAYRFTGTLYGKYYDKTFDTWDQYADWRTGIAALPESQIYAAFALLARNAGTGISPNQIIDVGYRFKAMVYGVWMDCPSGAGCTVDPADVGDDAWNDPLTSFHNGNPSWYYGNRFGFDTGHLVGSDPASAHIDPFGPFNPLHYLVQLPSMLFPGGRPGTAQCAVNGGCTMN